MQLFVISMHRSGSSVVSRLLNMMGAYFGGEGAMTAPNKENPKGFWERRDIRALNDRLLNAGGCDWDRIGAFDFEVLPTDVLDEARATAGRIILDLDAHRPWVLKEPRFCFTLPLYRPLLEMPVVILVHRDPLEVAMSLEQRNGFGLLEGVGLWESYNRAALRVTSGLPRITVSHGRLMRDPGTVVGELFERLGAEGVVGLRQPSEREITAFIDPALYRQRRAALDPAEFLNGRQSELARALETGELSEPALVNCSEGGRQALVFLEDRLTVEARTRAAVDSAVEAARAEAPTAPEADPVEQRLEALEATLLARIEETLGDRFDTQAEDRDRADEARARESARLTEEVAGLAHDQQANLDQVTSQLGALVQAREADRSEAELRIELTETRMNATVLQERMRTLLHFVDSLWDGYQTLERELSRRGGASRDVLALAEETAALARSFQEDLALTRGTAVWRIGRRLTDALGALARLPKSGLEERVVEHGRAADALDQRREKARARLPETDAQGQVTVLRDNRHLRPVYETVRGTALAQLYGLQDRFVPEASMAVILLPPYGEKLLGSLLTQLQMHAAYSGYEILLGESAAAVAEPWLRQLPIRIVPDGDCPNLATWINRCVAGSEADVLCLLETRLRLYQDPFSPLVRALATSGADYVGAAPLEESRSSRSRVAGIAARIHFTGERGVSLGAEAVDLAVAVEAAGELTPFATPLAIRREAFERVGGLHPAYAGGDSLEDLLLKLRFDAGLRGQLLTNLAVTARAGQRLARAGAADAALINARFGQRLRRHFFDHLPDRAVAVLGRPFTVAFAVTDCDSAGDYLTARELGRELARQFSWTVRYVPEADWDTLPDVDVVVAMVDAFDPTAIRTGEAHLLRVAWARNWFERWLDADGADDFDLFLSASAEAAERARTLLGQRSRTFRIATNEGHFGVEPSGARDLDYLFPGSYFGVERDVMRCLDPDALPWTGVVLGKGWEGFDGFRHIWRGFAAYETLASWYARARIVIDDANHVTREWGSVNSRVYDALASGCLVITNSRAGSEDAFDGLLPVYDSPESLGELLRAYLEDEPRRLRLVRRLRKIVFERHSYSQRAAQFREAVSSHLRARLRFGIKVPCPDRAERRDWGDYHYARGIARVLRAQGHAVRLDFLPEWQRPAAATDDVVLVLRGLSAYEPRQGQVNLLWNISHPDKVGDAEYESYDHVFVASAQHAADLAARLRTPVTTLLQCTDATLFDREGEAAGTAPPTFVGNTRDQYRPAVRDAIAAGIDLAIYGKGWQGLVPDPLIRGDHLPNDELAAHYAEARYVLNDHWPSMAEHGFLSNRLFDAGLAGATIVSDPVPGLEDIFGDLVATYRDHRELARIDRRLGKESDADRRARAATLRQLVRSRHTFEHRVQTLSETAEALTATPPLPRDRWEPSTKPASASALVPATGKILRDRRLRRLTVLVLAWDTRHNPVGRAFMLAEALARHFHVILAGPGFDRYGDGLWPPLRGQSAVTIVRFEGGATDEYMARCAQLAERVDADLVLACKPRLPSLGLGILIKLARRRPLIVDVDDHELAFFGDAPPLPLAAAADGLPEQDLPFGEGWTRLCESLIPAADGIIVSNVALQERFGGTIVPHARDERRFDPSAYDRRAERARLGLPQDDRIVLFLGTPRPHKGLAELLEAVLAQNAAAEHVGPVVRLCVIGSFDDRGFRKRLVEAGGEYLHLLANQPFEDLPRNLAVADVICLMQDPDHPISRYQLPAKLIDAIAMGIPALVTETPPVAPLLSAGLASATTVDTLEVDLARVLGAASTDAGADDAGDHNDATKRRERFLASYSYQAINETLVPLCLDALRRGPSEPEESVRDLFARWRDAASPGRRNAGEGLDLVFLWKQADSSLYGRRIDMLASYAARDPRVASVAVFDAPLPIDQLQRWERADPAMQHRHVARRIWMKRWGLVDQGTLSWHSFVHDGSRAPHPAAPGHWPGEDGFPAFVRSELERLGRRPEACVFVVYPAGAHLLPVINDIGPRAVLADVVDDQRTWPGLDEARSAALDAEYRAILGRSDAVFANCEPVREAMAGYADSIHLIENAAEPALETEDLPVPVALAELERPIVGYVGNFEAAKFDEALVRMLAESRSELEFVLIGSTHMNPDLPARMADLPNVRFPGVVPYDELPAWVARFACAIIPHLDTPQTRSMNPLKSYVYAAIGIPIVSTAVSNLAALDKEHLVVARSERSFRRAVDDFVGKPRPEGIRVPAAQCWPERIDRLIALVNSLAGAPGPAAQSD